MKGKILFVESPDSSEEPCPFCISLSMAYENFEKNIPFEFLPPKIDIKQGDPRVELVSEVSNKLGKKGEIFAPVFINEGKADAATRGTKYFEGKFRYIFRKWLLFQ